MAKLTEQQVIEIRRLKGVLNMDQVARKFGVSPSRICTIWKGTGWKTLTK